MDAPADRSLVVVAGFDPGVRTDMAGLLRVCGYRVAEVETGFQARARCRSDAVALVLLDMELPDMRTADVLALVRQDLGEAAPPVILLTRKRWDEETVEAVTLGARDVICWPAQPVEALARVESVLRSKASYDSLLRRHEDLLRALKAGCRYPPLTA